MPQDAFPSAPLLPSVSNLRDLGGLATASGRVTVPRRLYRSNHFGDLAPGDRPALDALGLRTVVDLRGVQESLDEPDCAWPAGVTALHLPIEPRALGALRELREAGTADEVAVREVMNEGYRRYVRQHAAVFAALLQRLLDAASHPLVFHCTAGKDRTGFATALILTALGVPHATIVDDYLLSNQRWLPKVASSEGTLLSQVRPEYLQTAFDTMVADWGSVEAYLQQALGVDEAARARLAELLLSP